MLNYDNPRRSRKTTFLIERALLLRENSVIYFPNLRMAKLGMKTAIDLLSSKHLATHKIIESESKIEVDDFYIKFLSITCPIPRRHPIVDIYIDEYQEVLRELVGRNNLRAIAGTTLKVVSPVRTYEPKYLKELESSLNPIHYLTEYVGTISKDDL